MNKTNYLEKTIYVLFITILLFSCSTSKVFQTECTSLDTSGHIEITIWDAKKGGTYSIEQARKDAIYAILYNGVAGGKNCSSQPPMLNGEEERAAFGKIEKQFFSKSGQWNRFTASSKLTNAAPESIGNNNWKVYQVSVSKKELRNFLEEQNILQKLNKGF